MAVFLAGILIHRHLVAFLWKSPFLLDSFFQRQFFMTFLLPASSREYFTVPLKNILSQINVLPLPDGLVQASKFEDLFPDFASQDLMNISSRYGNTEPPAYHQTCEV